MTEKHKGCVHHAYSKIGWVVAFCGCDHVSIMTMKIEKVYQRWEVHYSGSGKMNPVWKSVFLLVNIDPHGY